MYPNLQAEMSRRNLNIRKFSMLLGMPYNSVREKLRGNRPLTFQEALKIKQTLCVDIPLEILFSQEMAS